MGLNRVSAIDALTNGMRLVSPGGAIQSAIDAVNGTKTVGLLPGTYTLTSPLSYPSSDANFDMRAVVPGTVTITLNDSAAGFSSASRSMLTNETPTAKVSQTGITTAYPAGTTQVTLTSAANADVGDLIQLRRTTVTTGNEGEIRKIIAISGTTVTLDYPIYTNSFDGTSMRIDVYAPRSAVVQGITFDLSNHAAGHGGISFFNLMDVRIEDCRFITGGQHGAYVMGSHTVRYLRCHAEDMDVRDASWTPERSGESLIAAGRSADVAGEGYGLAMEATDGWAIDCTFRRCRHFIAAGGGSFNSTNITYQSCRGTQDLQGAYDMHPNVNHGLITDCAASRGWAGGWIRGKHITVEKCTFSDEASEGIRLLDSPDFITLRRNTLRTCAHGIRGGSGMSGTRRAIAMQDNEILDSTTNAIATSTGPTYTDMRIERNLIRGGTFTLLLPGKFDGLLIAGNRWDGAHTYGAGQSPNLIYLQVDDAAGACKNLRILDNDFQPEGASGTNDIGYCARLGKAAGASVLADGTYQDVRIERNTLRTGVTSFAMTIVDNNATPSRATVTGVESIVDNVRNGSRTTGQTRAQGSTSIADGGTITHNLARTPTCVQLTGSVAGEPVSVTTKGATTITVAIKKSDGSAGTTQTVEWIAEVA